LRTPVVAPESDPRVIATRRIVRSNIIDEGEVMAESVRRVEYHYVTVPDLPGEGERVFSMLRDRRVNLLAVLGFPTSGGRTQIDLVPEDPEALREAAENAGLSISEVKQAFLIQGDDRMGVVGETLAKLAALGVNVTADAAVSDGRGHYGMIVWVAAEEYERAAGALGV
jgi:hypothetical protein